jgi:hypothetical protein
MNPRLTADKGLLFGRAVEAAQQALHPSASQEGAGDSKGL